MRRKKDEHDTALVKNDISTALLLLMEQNDYQSITVTDVAKKAGVSRMTYYRTYSSKEDILIQYFNDLANDFMAEIKTYPNLTLYQLTVDFLTFFREHSNLIPTLKKAGLHELILRNFLYNLQTFYANISDGKEMSTSAYYHLHFSAGGLAFAIILWGENGYKETPEQVAQIITPLISLPIESSDSIKVQ